MNDRMQKVMQMYEQAFFDKIMQENEGVSISDAFKRVLTKKSKDNLLTHLKGLQGEQVSRRLMQGKQNIPLSTAWNVIESADPSPNKKNVRWLVETYINNGFLWKDIVDGPTSKMYKTLHEFERHKSRLENDNRSLTKYRSLSQLYKVIHPYIGQLTEREKKKIARDKAYKEADVIADKKDGLKIIVPNTRYASKWFGRGTRWCTAAEDNNLFNTYAFHAPLFITILPNGERLQFYRYPDGSYMILNSQNECLRKDDYKDCIHLIKHILRWLKGKPLLKYNNLTHEQARNIVEHNGFSLRHMSRFLWTDEILELAVRNNPLALSCIPAPNKVIAFFNRKKLRHYQKIINIAVSGNAQAVEYVPEKYKNMITTKNINTRSKKPLYIRNSGEVKALIDCIYDQDKK